MAGTNLPFDELHRTLLYAHSGGEMKYQLRTLQQIRDIPATERVWRPEWKSDEQQRREFAQEAVTKDLAQIRREQGTAWVMNQTEDALDGPQLSDLYEGLEFVSCELRRTYLRPQWHGQKFAPSATAWELKRSVLAFPGITIKAPGVPVTPIRPWFYPVVVPGNFAGHAKVIAHVGIVNGVDLIAPRQSAGMSSTPKQLVAAGGIVFVAEDSEASRPPSGWVTVGFSSHTYTVFTTPDGQVLHVLAVKDGDALIDLYKQAKEWVWEHKWDILAVIVPEVTPVLLRLATRGRQTLLSLVARLRDGRLARTVFEGASSELAASATNVVIGTTVKEVGLDAAMAARGLKLGGYEKRMGIPQRHLQKMVEAARETNTVAVFRANKEVAIDLIEKGAIGKPKSLSIPGFKSDPNTGVLTAVKQHEIDLVQKNGYYLLELSPGKPPMMRLGNELKPLPRESYWTKANNQVIDVSGHPVVGDYDGLGAMPLDSPGRNIVPVPKDPTSLKSDWLGPDWDRYMKAVNPKLDKQRVLHGAQDQLHMVGGGLDDGIAYAVFPDGRAVIMNGRAEQKAFYEAFSRETSLGAYPKPSPNTPVVDELAARRKPK